MFFVKCIIGFLLLLCSFRFTWEEMLSFPCIYRHGTQFPNQSPLSPLSDQQSKPTYLFTAENNSCTAFKCCNMNVLFLLAYFVLQKFQANVTIYKIFFSSSTPKLFKSVQLFDISSIKYSANQPANQPNSLHFQEQVKLNQSIRGQFQSQLA